MRVDPTDPAMMVTVAGLVSTPLRIGGTTVRNRLYRAPVLEGAGDGPDAAEVYARHFVANARHGVGLIIQGSACIWPEGRTSPGMSCVDTREKVIRLAPMVEAVHREGAAIFLQIGHGGLYAMEAWHEPYASRPRGPILAASPVPLPLRPSFRGIDVHVMTTAEVRDMATRYGDVAAWAREAGYDGVQLGSANAKLLDQFLSPFYNRRTDEFGGSLERRAHVLRLIREAVAERAGDDFPCTVKVPAESAPPGFLAPGSAKPSSCAGSSRSGASTRLRPSRCRCSPTRRCRAAVCRIRSGPTGAWPSGCAVPHRPASGARP